MPGDALFVVPTRAARRPRLETFLAAFADTRTADTRLLIATDDDEQGAWDSLQLPAGCAVRSAPRMPLSPKVNRWAVPAARQASRPVGFLADDTVPETPGWDARLIETLARAPGIAYPSGLRADIPEHHLTSAVIITALGWYFEPSLHHYYTDNVLADLGNGAGCLRYVPGVTVRHDRHPPGSPGDDQVYREAAVQGPADQAAYHHWRCTRMAGDIATVKAAIAS